VVLLEGLVEVEFQLIGGGYLDRDEARVEQADAERFLGGIFVVQQEIRRSSSEVWLKRRAAEPS
jgi:hypothetical protein